MEKIKSLFRSRPKLMIGLVIVLALSLPFVINQVLKQQDVRQRADSAPAISFNFANPIQNVKIGDSVTLALLVNAGTNDIGALHFKINYSSGLTENAGVSITSPYTAIQQSNTQDGQIELTLVNTTNTKVTGNSQDILKFGFKALKAGQIKVTVDDIQATASLFSTYVPVENAGNIISTITVMDPNTPLSPTVTTTTAPSPTQAVTVSTTPTNSPTPSPTPLPTSTPSPSPTPLPTSTPIPTPTIAASETIVKVAVSLPAIGNTLSGDNNAPKTTTRQVTAIVYDSQNALVPSSIGVLTYNSTNGKFEGQIGVAAQSTTSTSYRIKLKLNNTLFKFIPGIITIVPAATTNVAPSVELVPGDLTGASNEPDNTLDILDYNLFQACYRGQPACTTEIAKRADFNDDGVVNGDDIDANILSRGFYIRNGD